MSKEEDPPKGGMFRSAGEKIRRIRWYNALHTLVVILERLTRRIKHSFLNMESALRIWKKRIYRKKTQESSEQDTPADKNIFEKLKDYNLGKTRSLTEEEQDEEEIRPMISDEIVSPEPKSEVAAKDRLEELLIDRIAVNPKDTEAYERLGEYYMEIKSYEFAKECFKQVMKLDPLNRKVKYQMRRLENLLSKR